MGRLLVDRLFLKNKINPAEIDNLNRLAVVQESGMGALTYKPKHIFKTENNVSDFDHCNLLSLFELMRSIMRSCTSY